MSAMEKIDCVVVGAGWFGLAAAKQYNRIHPDSSLTVFDSQPELGGGWAKFRLYPGLKSNNLLGTFEYPDFPMDSATFGVQPGQHIPGEVVNRYLNAYVDKFGLGKFVRLSTKVLTAEHREVDDDGGWILTVAGADQTPRQVYAHRLIVATGLTSKAFLPHFEGQENFGGRIFHGKQFKQNSDTLKTATSVTVLGAGKSGWDTAYAYAVAGVKVHWVIRSSGHGPVWMAPPYVTPLKKWIEQLPNMRFMSWMSPCIWGDVDGYGYIRRLLHGTAIGRFLVDIFWKSLGNDIMTLNGFDKHPETAKLKPWTHPMFTGTSFSILNYEVDIFELVRAGNIQVHISDIDHLSAGKVHLADDTDLESDVLVSNTGWQHVPPIKFLPEGIEKELGIPHKPDPNAPQSDLANQKSLIDHADREILARFPRLKDQPVWNKNYVPLTEQKGIRSEEGVTPYTPLTPFMMYHFIVPPSERFLRPRDIAFIGNTSNFSNMITAHVASLWVSAYFAGRLARDPRAAVGDSKATQKLRYETVLFNRFGRWRYPTDWGDKHPNFIFDAVPYLDLLQRDLGLGPHRKKGFLAEICSPYGPRDYQNITEEWLSIYGGKQ